jgi:hypothetical protein
MNLGWEMHDAEIHRFKSCRDFCSKVDSGCHGLRFDGPFLNWEAVALYKPNAIIGAVAHGAPLAVCADTARYRQSLSQWLHLTPRILRVVNTFQDFAAVPNLSSARDLVSSHRSSYFQLRGP